MATLKKSVAKKPVALPHVVVDFESYYDNECSVSTLGAEAYTRHPKFEAYMVSVYDGPKGSIKYVGHPKDFNWASLKGRQVVAHNAQFDWTIFNAAKRENWWKKCPKTLDFGSWRDTAALAAFLGAPRSLAGACKELLGIELSKGMRDWMKGRTFDDAVREGKADALAEYAMHDSIYAWQLYEDFHEMMPIEEWRLSQWTTESGMRGVAIDVKLLNSSIAKLAKHLIEVSEAIPWLNDDSDSKPTSSKALAQACRDVGIPPPKSTAKTSVDFDLWLDEYSDKAPFVKAMQEYRSVNRVLAVLHSIRMRQCDGVLTFSKKYYGAHTGRFSGDGGLNMENFPREPVCGVNLRNIIISRPKKKLVIADWAQIEARILLWFADDEPALKLIATGMSVYEAHARQTMDWKGGVLKKENDLLYRLAKARVLGLGYQCGAPKFVHAAKTMANYDITLAESKKTVLAYRATNKGIVALWDRLHAEAVSKTNAVTNPSGAWIIELPSGRPLRYFNLKRMRHPKFGSQVMAQSWMGYAHRSIYGGLLTENLVQATARDVLRDGVLNLIDAGYDPLMSIHDEIVVEVDDKVDPQVIAKILRQTPEWLKGCPMDVEFEASKHYKK